LKVVEEADPGGVGVEVRARFPTGIADPGASAYFLFRQAAGWGAKVISPSTLAG
jgi:hypothetical protein